MLPSGPAVRSAIENDRLIPVFQPIVNLRSGFVSGFEVLTRWNHPQEGLILPGNFIRLAEELGLIDRLTENVLRRAFTAAVKTIPQRMLNINISPLQLRNRALPAWLRSLCSETGWPLQQLTIEITESAIIDNQEMASRVTSDLKSMGCRLSLDDFGTGYSSLLHLQMMPFDDLKIDRSFVSKMTERRESRKIVGAVIELAHNLGLTPVAEGVETEAQCELLYRLDCHSGQGWLYGRPKPALEIDNCTECRRKGLCEASKSRYVQPGPTLGPATADQAAQLKALYNGAPVGLCLLDTQMRYVSINRQLAEINGHSEKTHLGRTPQEIVPDIFAKIEPHIRGALAGQAPSHFELTRTNPADGIARTLSLNYAPVFDETAEVIGVSVAVVDLTQRMQAEDALRLRVEQYGKFLEQSLFSPWLADKDLNLREVSPRWMMLTGMTEEESRGMGWLRAVHPEDIATRVEAIFRSLQTRESFEVQFRMKSWCGEWRWVRTKGWAVFGPAGELTGWSGYLVDLEELRSESDRALVSLKTADYLRAGTEFPYQ
ncbi:MAG TPA: EAL domain-containing protein [Terracidiphilus sp.]|jgi:PAS domain S-box-containing protein